MIDALRRKIAELQKQLDAQEKMERATEADSIRNQRGTLYDEGKFGRDDRSTREKVTDKVTAKAAEFATPFGGLVGKKLLPAFDVDKPRDSYKEARKERLKQATEADMVRNTRGTLYDEGEFAPEQPRSFAEAMEDRLADMGVSKDDAAEEVEETRREMSPKKATEEPTEELTEELTEEPAEAPKAEAVYTPEQAQELFKVAHGSDFDPKSEMDKRKMKEIEETLVEQGGLGDKSPNRFALDIYRKYKYV